MMVPTRPKTWISSGAEPGRQFCVNETKPCTIGAVPPGYLLLVLLRKRAVRPLSRIRRRRSHRHILHQSLHQSLRRNHHCFSKSQTTRKP